MVDATVGNSEEVVLENGVVSEDVVVTATSLEVTEVISLVVDRVTVGVTVVPTHYWIEIY